MLNTMLYIFSGLPATGKSTLALGLAQSKRAVYVRVDTIEQALREAGASVEGSSGYVVGHAVAADNLRLGLSVVADSVNPLKITRDAWRMVAEQLNITVIEIEVICSDLTLHRHRVESRTVNVPGLKLPSWDQVVHREVEPWDRDHVVIDTAGHAPEDSLSKLLAMVG